MCGSIFTKFAVYVALLITFLGLINMIFDLHGFAFIIEFLILLGLLLVAVISAAGIATGSRWPWILLKIFFIFVFLDMILIYVFSSVETPYFLLLLVVVIAGFFISFFNICKPKAEEVVEKKVRKGRIKVEKVYAEKADNKQVKKTFKPGKFIASKTGVKYHAPKCDWAKKIKKKNAVWFNSKEEAKKAGYKKDDCVK